MNTVEHLFNHRVVYLVESEKLKISIISCRFTCYEIRPKNSFRQYCNYSTKQSKPHRECLILNGIEIQLLIFGNLIGITTEFDHELTSVREPLEDQGVLDSGFFIVWDSRAVRTHIAGFEPRTLWLQGKLVYQ